MAVSDHRAIWLTAHRPTYTHAGPEAMSGPAISHLVCQVPGFVEACLGRFLSCCCVFVFCLLWCDSAQGEVRAACVVPVDPG